MDNKFIKAATPFVAVAALILALFGFFGNNQPTARGVTNFSSLTLSDDLVVGGTSTTTGATTQNGDFTVGGTTPLITIGDAGAEDTTLLYDGNAQDFYLALDDSADDLLIGLGSTVGTTPAIAIDENLDITLHDASASDADITFDGNAQDFYVCLDDSEDDLVLGFGATCGTTPGISIDESQNTDVAGTLQFGASNFYPVGYASSGEQIIVGTASITGTLAAPHGLTTVTFCLASLGEDPTAGAGDAAHVSVAVSANVCTLKAWQDDFVTAATETDVAVHWLVIGTP